MPISEKIINEINAANVTEAEKKLMIDILTIEDEGVYQYVGPYEKIIKKHIDNEETQKGNKS